MEIARPDIPSSVERLLQTPPALFFEQVIKINDHYNRQRRFIILTQREFYNIKKSVFGNYSVQRRIPISQIEGVIVNRYQNQFVLKMNTSVKNDYRYEGDCWQLLMQMLRRLSPVLSVYSVSDDLDKYVRMKNRSAAVDVRMMIIPDKFSETSSATGGHLVRDS